MKIGMIGFGNMAQAMLEGFLLKELVEPKDVFVCAAHYDLLCLRAQQYGIHACHGAQEVIDQSELILLAIKPYQVEALVPSLDFQEKLLVSVVAGYSFEKLSKLVSHGNTICIIPNTPIAIGEGITLVEEETNSTPEELESFMSLFSPVSLVQFVDEAHMKTALILASCAPAFADLMIEALGDAGVEYGLDRKMAYTLAAKMLVGTGGLYLEKGLHPGAMKDAVCSPKGMTIKGVTTLEKRGFRASLIEAVEAIEES